MKKLIALSWLVAAIAAAAVAQAPQAIPYQAVARDATGNLLVNQNISLRFTIQNSTGSQVYYQETHSAVTSKLGLFNVSVGTGSVTQGSFSNINWNSGSIYIQVEMDPAGGSNFTVMGTSPIQSVPYALYAGTAASAPVTSNAPLSGAGTPGSPLNIGQASASGNGYLSSADWNTFNNKQNSIALTTNGSSGAATFNSNTLNVPQYTLAALGGQAALTFNAPLSNNSNNISLGYDNSSIKMNGSNQLYAPNTGTVTSINTSAPITGGVITASGTIGCASCVTSSAGGALTAGTGIGVSGSIVSNTGVTSLAAGTGISLSGSSGAITVSNTGAPASGSNNYIQNQTSSAQNSAGFWVSGTGEVDGGTLSLGNSTSNLIAFNAIGVAAPAFTTRSTGTKIVLYPQMSSTSSDYALGVDAYTMWYSTPGTTSGLNTFQHVFYGGNTELMCIQGSGNVGIGNTAPNELLCVGNGTMAGGSLNGIDVGISGGAYLTASDGTHTAFIGADNNTGAGIVGTYTNHALVLRTDNIQRMSISAAGLVTINNLANASYQVLFADANGDIVPQSSVTFTSTAQADAAHVPSGYYNFNFAGSTGTQQLYYQSNMSAGLGYVLVFQSPYQGTAIVNMVGNSFPYYNFLIQTDVMGYRSTAFFTTKQLFNAGTSTTTATGGDHAGYNVILGSAGGMGIYNTTQTACNWSNGAGAVGAGYITTGCGSYPNQLVWGVGVSGQPQYTPIGGNWQIWIANH